MRITDTHIHLNFAGMDEIRQNLLESCIRRGISSFIIPDVAVNNINQNISYHGCRFYFAAGVHPLYISTAPKLTLETVERGNYSAIGEIGMDLRKNIPHLPDADLQMKVFSEQLDIAAEMSLPLIIHCVRAHEQLLRLIKNNGFSCGGVVHGFTGSLETARQWIKSGFKLGIGPFIVNPRMTDRQRRMLGSVGIENILLETDAPNNYIDQNFAIGVPVSLHNTLETVASIYGIDVEKAADIIESNVHSLFFT